MEENVINDKLLDDFKAGKISKKGIHTRTNFRVKIQNAIDSVGKILEVMKWQLTTNEIKSLEDMVKLLEMIRDE